jgi:hypothetical protein
VRPGAVVVEQVSGQYQAQVLLVDYQQPTEELAPQGAGHPFADGVRSGRLRRAAENPGALRGKHSAEGLSELPCTIPDQELDSNCALAQVHQEIACCLFSRRAWCAPTIPAQSAFLSVSGFDDSSSDRKTVLSFSVSRSGRPARIVISSWADTGRPARSAGQATIFDPRPCIFHPRSRWILRATGTSGTHLTFAFTNRRLTSSEL